MSVNPLIRNRVDCLNVPDKIKMILNKILDAESSQGIQDDKKGAVLSISKILEKYADEKDVKEFCS